jgi:hypothetical protein
VQTRCGGLVIIFDWGWYGVLNGSSDSNRIWGRKVFEKKKTFSPFQHVFSLSEATWF